MCLKDVAFLPSKTISSTTCVLKMRLGLSKGMLPVKYFCSTKALLCQSNLMEIIRRLTKMS